MGDFPARQNWHAGNPSTSNNHRQLISLVHQLQEAVYLGHNRKILETALNQLVRYTEEHFGRIIEGPMQNATCPEPAAAPMKEGKCHWITA